MKMTDKEYKDLCDYVLNQFEDWEIKRELSYSEHRYPLSCRVKISDAVQEWCEDTGYNLDDVWEQVGEEDIFWDMINN